MLPPPLLPPGPPPLPSLPDFDPPLPNFWGGCPFCAEHWCASGCCDGCRAELKYVAGVPPIENASSRHHYLYLHVQKTGGSTIECATAPTFVKQGLWTNMGHNNAGLRRCTNHCTFYGRRPKVVISIREPYQWWRSLYRYAYVGWCSSWQRGKRGPRWDTFAQFVNVVKGTDKTQSKLIERSCGKPCHADYFLHTESLASDWRAFLLREQLPLIKLPRLNPGNAHENHAGRTIFTEEILKVINSVEADMFDQFGYTRRHTPFELK